jgi:DNA polymerase III subunit alpha
MSGPFTHLHLHTQYSLLDGAIRIKQLPPALLDKGFNACAITDHGNLFGAVEFYQTLKKAGVKPIIGIEAYVAEGSRHQRKYERPGPNAAHLILLCENRAGYRNLIRLASLGYLEGKFYGFPRIDRELLERHNEGLIALSACLGGVVNRHLMAGRDEQAREAAHWYGQVFEGRFYLELQEHGQPEEARANARLLQLAEELRLPLVGTNDCHYLTPEEAYPHYLLQLIGWQKKVTDPAVTPFVDRQLYLKSPEEMRGALAAYPAQAFANAGAIAERCELSLESSQVYLPKYDIPAGYTLDDWLRKEAAEGLERRCELLEGRYGIAADAREAFRKPYLERLAYELGVITSMKYAGYFLIVADFINWAKNAGVRVGPGRGSGAGSLVAYALRITDLDPIHHKLLFERFLNPERVSLPDFDIDFDVAGRDKVIDYVRRKYGENKVCQISTFGTLGAKAALRNVARVLDFPYSQADKIAKLIPNKLGITLPEAIDLEPELARMEREGEENERLLIRCGKALEGLNSNLSTHAAGVIIMDADIQDIMPVCSPVKGEGLQSMYSMKYAEDQGAVKFDFLGLLNLTIIQRAVQLINDPRPPGEPAFDVDEIALDDAPTYKLLGRADTTGIFQLESGGMRRLLLDLKPETFDDIVAIQALYRPGPLGSGMTDDFVKRKNEQRRNPGAPVDTLHPRLQEVLKDTYGVMAYQEQVMEAARVLAGYSLGQADLLRRAIGKKIPAEMEQQRGAFVEGCVRNGIDRGKATEIFDKIDYFSGYGFNRSHSAAYGLVSYQTAYLKAHHPVEFMAALLSSDMDNTDKVVSFIADCRDMGITVLPPDVNHSRSDFTIEGRAVRFGLSAVKNVGENAVAVILESRDAQPDGRFADLSAFLRGVDLHRVNKRVLEALVRCGGFDSLHRNRAELLAALDDLVRLGLDHQNHQVEGQENLFDLLGDEAAAAVHLHVELPSLPDLHPRQRLKLEKEALGFYISGHPLQGYRSEVGNLAVSSHDVREGECDEGAEVLVAGMVGSMTVRMNRNAEKMAILRLEDLRGSIEVVVFPRLYAEVQGLLREDEPLLIRARVNVRDEEINLQANQVMSLSRYRAEQARRLTLALESALPEAQLPRLVGVLAKTGGPCAVHLRVATAGGSHVRLDTGLAVTPSEALMEELEEIVGPLAAQFDYPREADARPAYGSHGTHGSQVAEGAAPPAAYASARGEARRAPADSA